MLTCTLCAGLNLTRTPEDVKALASQELRELQVKPLWKSGGGLERGEVAVNTSSLGASSGAGGQAQLGAADKAAEKGTAETGQATLGVSEVRCCLKTLEHREHQQPWGQLRCWRPGTAGPSARPSCWQGHCRSWAGYFGRQ